MYESSDTAKDAWDTACENCTGNKTVAGIQMKYEDGVIASDPFVAFAAVCGNVYLAIVVTAENEDLGQLGYDAGAVAAATYKKAYAQGMSRCSE